MEEIRDTAEEFERPAIDYKSIIKPTLQYELYNPSEKSQHFSKAGVEFYLPAKGKKWRGQDPSTGQTITYPKPGVMPVWGIPEQKITALQVVQFAVGEDGISGVIGENGVRALFGEDKQDELVYEDAHKACLRKEVADANLTIHNHERAVAVARAANEQPPIPGRMVQDAYARLAKAGSEADEFFPVRCATCNLGLADEKAMWLHVLGTHRDRKAEAEKALGLDETGGKMVTVPREPPTPVPTMSEEDALETARLMNSGHSEDPRLLEPIEKKSGKSKS